VDVDNAAGAAMGTQYLIDSGRKRVATIAGPDDMQVAIDRAEGWQRALVAAGREADLLVRGDFTRATGAEAMRQLLELDPTIDGVFAASDLMAAGAVAVLRERGIRVPQDVAVVGFDDISPATLGDVQLTTVHQPSREMGHEMGAMLLALLRGEARERQRTMPTWMVVRESA
jgi:LacI family transcriptional regulator